MSDLNIYYDMYHEPIDYKVGDYIALKSNAHLFENKYICPSNIGPSVGYVFDMDDKTVKMWYFHEKTEYVTYMCIKQFTSEKYLYKKLTNEPILDELIEYINDNPVTIDCVQGVNVRLRKNLKIIINGKILNDKFILKVLENKNGDVTVIGCIDDCITKITVKWYELAY